MKFVSARDIVVATITIELSRNTIYFTRMRIEQEQIPILLLAGFIPYQCFLCMPRAQLPLSALANDRQAFINLNYTFFADEQACNA